MRISLGRGQVAEAVKLCRELRDNQQGFYTPASQAKAAACCSLPLWGLWSWGWARLDKPRAPGRDAALGWRATAVEHWEVQTPPLRTCIFLILAFGKRDSLRAAQRFKLRMKTRCVVP